MVASLSGIRLAVAPPGTRCAAIKATAHPLEDLEESPMLGFRPIPILIAAILVPAAIVGCDRRDDVPRPKTDASAPEVPKAPGVGAASDRSKANPPAGPVATVPEGDRTFATKAASAGLAEVAITQHTMDKAANAEVKRLAQHLHKDHAQANEELKAIAALKGIALPAAPEGEKKVEVEQVGALSGADLDRMVLQKLETSHRESIKLFEREASEGADLELKAFASKTLPTLREHLKMVEAAADGGAAKK
jgi:putative membrane protein